MKYIIRKGTPLFEKLSEVKTKMNIAFEAAGKIIQRLGAVEYYQKYSPDIFYGGIDAIYFPNGNPDNKIFKAYKGGGNGYNMFAPKIKSELYKEIEALPTIQNKEVNDLINFKQGFIRNTNRYLFRPSISFKEDMVLISVDEDKEYTPVADMEEIKAEEYYKFYKQEEV